MSCFCLDVAVSVDVPVAVSVSVHLSLVRSQFGVCILLTVYRELLLQNTNKQSANTSDNIALNGTSLCIHFSFVAFILAEFQVRSEQNKNKNKNQKYKKNKLNRKRKSEQRNAKTDH